MVLNEAPGLARLPVADQVNHLMARHPGNVSHTYEHALRGFAARMSEEDAQALAADPSVKYVTENSRVTKHATQFNAPWGLDRVDQVNSTLNGTYNYAVTGAGVHVYVIDSGIRVTHSDFGGRATADFTAINDGNGALDCEGHGTHVAGTIGGNTWGVAKGVRLHSVRVLGCNGKGTTAQSIAGIDWVAANRILPAVANYSVGGPEDPALDDAVLGAIAAGVTFVASAGNEGLNACWDSPGRVPEVLTVGATNASDTRASGSNTGPCVDLFAPGVGITSASNASNTASEIMDGTSMAAPHVAGAAALFLQYNPGATPARVHAALTGFALMSKVQQPGPNSPNRLLHTPLLGEPGTTLVAQISGLCLDIFDASFTPGVMLIQYPCLGDANQWFSLYPVGGGYYQIVVRHSGQCLDVNNGSTAPGTSIIQYPCNGEDGQRFYMQPMGGGYHRFIAKHSGQCLDVNGGSTGPAQIIQWTCNGEAGQNFRVN
ncbi:RICIN domain-containing protein [Pyxidicoccus sp. 3LFB2]